MALPGQNDGGTGCISGGREAEGVVAALEEGVEGAEGVEGGAGDGDGGGVEELVEAGEGADAGFGDGEGAGVEYELDVACAWVWVGGTEDRSWVGSFGFDHM